MEYLIILLVSLLSVFIMLYVRSLLKIKALTETVVKAAILTSISNIVDNDNEDLDIHKENFIKFLSDSRDWAFQYIDQSQKQIKEFVDMADKEFAFFDSFGSLTQEYPHYEEMKKISEEYKKLKSLLPEETNDKR